MFLENIIPLIRSFLPIFSEYLIFYVAALLIGFAGFLVHRLFRGD